MYYLKLGLTRLTPPDLVAKSMRIESSMKGNPYFPSPEPALADVRAKREEFNTLIGKAAAGDRIEIAHRNFAYNELQSMLRKLATYVSLMADGRDFIILDSGFEVRKPKEPLAPVKQPKKFAINTTERGGEIKFSWKKVTGAVSYILEMGVDDPSETENVWINKAVTAQCRYKMQELTSGTKYAFRVRAVGRKQTSPCSAVQWIKVT